MSLGILVDLYGWFVVCIAGIALANPKRWSRHHGNGSSLSSARLNITTLWFGLAVQAGGLFIPALHQLVAVPLGSWLFITGLCCLLSWTLYLALTPTGKTIQAMLANVLKASKGRDTSHVPGEIARKLQKKTGLRRLPQETDLDYIHRCREHVMHRLIGRQD